MKLGHNSGICTVSNEGDNFPEVLMMSQEGKSPEQIKKELLSRGVDPAEVERILCDIPAESGYSGIGGNPASQVNSNETTPVRQGSVDAGSIRGTSAVKESLKRVSFKNLAKGDAELFKSVLVKAIQRLHNAFNGDMVTIREVLHTEFPDKVKEIDKFLANSGKNCDGIHELTNNSK
jgi:hypothetical protein